MDATLLTELMQYCKVETEADDVEVTGLLIPLYSSAKAIIKSQTGKTFSETAYSDTEQEQRRQLYWLAIEMMVLHWYQNRGNTTDTTINNIPITAERIIKVIALDSDFDDDTDDTTE